MKKQENKNKPNIYVLSWRVGDNSFGCTTTYLEFINKFGNARLLMPDQMTPPDDCDILLIPGGADLHASSIGQTSGFVNSNPDNFKQAFFQNGLKNFIDAKIPICAICWGHQAIGAYFGFDFKQNLDWHPTSDKRYEEVHEIEFLNHTFYPGRPEKGNKYIYKCPSHHHQGLTIDRKYLDDPEWNGVLNDFIIESVYDNGVEPVIESMYHTTLPIFCTQFHIEESSNYKMDCHARNIMNHLLSFTNKNVEVGASVEQ